MSIGSTELVRAEVPVSAVPEPKRMGRPTVAP
jgi:hypothetical protein